MRQEGRPSKNKIFSERLNWLQIFFAISITFFVIYLFVIQVVDPKSRRIKAKRQRSASAFVMRGNIYDRNGNVLATSATVWQVYAVPNKITSE